ncbi:MAG: hypothetical protein KDK70_11700, partial [Myxococcales bacterium]|nr:hypothetical protein [Myxococcales bacterium]
MSPHLLRTQVIDALELIADREAQLRVQAQAPGIDVSLELLLQWEDGYRPDAPALGWAFDAAQQATLRAFHAIFLAVRDEVGLQPPPLARFVTTAAWRRYSDAARTA